MEREEADALFLGMLHLFQTGRHLHFGTTVHQGDVGTQALGRTARVHSRVTTAHHEHALGRIQWGIGCGIGCIHQVHTGEILI